MQRTIYVYDLLFKLRRIKNVKCPSAFNEDFVAVLQEICKMDIQDKTEDYKGDRKILYLDSINADVTNRIVKLIFVSAKYGMVRRVMDTARFVDRGVLKRKPDGDLEKNHLVIRFDENGSASAIALYEYNKDGIGFSKIMQYINDRVLNFHEKKEDLIYYKILHESVVSRDFLKSLEKIKRIKAVALTVSQENITLSESKEFAGRADISSDVDIVMKPVGRGFGILNKTVEEFYEKYKRKGTPIKRITVQGDRETKDPLIFDTEKMKEKYPVDVLEETNGEVDSLDMFREMVRLCQYF